MSTLLKRLFWLALLGGAGYAVWSLLRGDDDTQPAAPEWPPLDTTNSSSDGSAAASSAAEDAASAGATVAAIADVDATPAGDGDARWVEPTDGQCPISHPVKANDNSGIFHVPGGRFYERTGAERCYARAEDAEADGYRAAKS